MITTTTIVTTAGETTTTTVEDTAAVEKARDNTINILESLSKPGVKLSVSATL
jgi:hypothetical protein